MLEINFTLLIQAVNFNLLMLLLYFLLYKPLLGKMKERQGIISGDFRSAEDRRAEAQSLAETYEGELARARRASMESLARVQAEAAQEGALALEKAQESIASQIERAREEIAREVARAEAQLEGEARELAAEIARRIAGRAIGSPY